jgi:hypothetical protein
MMKVFFLVIYISTGGHGGLKDSTPFPSMKECLLALSAVKIVMPNGAENEATGTAYCATDDPFKGLFDK